MVNQNDWVWFYGQKFGFQRDRNDYLFMSVTRMYYQRNSNLNQAVEVYKVGNNYETTGVQFVYHF